MFEHQVILPCGCVVLADRDGPCAVLEPCWGYPVEVNPTLRGVENWERNLRIERVRKKKRPARKRKRTRRRTADA